MGSEIMSLLRIAVKDKRNVPESKFRRNKSSPTSTTLVAYKVMLNMKIL